MVNTLQRRKEKREPDLNGAAPSGAPAPPEEAQRPRSMTVSAATRVKLSFQIRSLVEREWPCWLLPALEMHFMLCLSGKCCWCGRWESCRQEGMHIGYWLIEKCTPKKHLFLSPSKWLGTILLGYDGDKLWWGGERAKSGWRCLTLPAVTSLSPVCEQQGEEMEACEELALALSRGLQLDTQRSSRDSLQCSSGYSTQTTTPCCSEDTIPSQGTHSGDVPF